MRLRATSLLAALLLAGVFCPASVFGQRSSGPSFSTAVRASAPSPSEYALSVSKTLAYDIPLDDRQAIRLSAEYVRATSVPKVYERQLAIEPSWKLKAVPLTVGYTYALTDPSNHIVPTLGFGVSYYITRAKKMAHAPAAALGEELMAFESPSPDPDYQERMGMGYGAQATLGLRFDVSRHLFLTAQGRARYVNGLAFSSGTDLGSEFTDLDFSLGFGFKL